MKVIAGDMNSRFQYVSIATQVSLNIIFEVCCSYQGSPHEKRNFDWGLHKSSFNPCVQAHKKETYHKRWRVFYSSRGINPVSASLEDGLEFFHNQYENGLSYRGINTARSAVSTIILLPDGSSFGNHPIVTRFLKGVFRSRTALPRYKDIWDVSVVLDYLKTLSLLEELHLIGQELGSHVPAL